MATSNASPKAARARPGTMRLTDALQYRLPLAGVVSILHRVSGALMFMLLPFVVWLLDVSLSSVGTYGIFEGAFAKDGGIGFVPSWLVKLVVLALIWAYLHHFIAGVRHLWMDMTHSVTKEFGRSSAVVTLVASALLTIVLGAKLFGAF